MTWKVEEPTDNTYLEVDKVEVDVSQGLLPRNLPFIWEAICSLKAPSRETMSRWCAFSQATTRNVGRQGKGCFVLCYPRA